MSTLGDRLARPTHGNRVQALDYSTILSLAMRIIDSAPPVRALAAATSAAAALVATATLMPLARCVRAVGFPRTAPSPPKPHHNMLRFIACSVCVLV